MVARVVFLATVSDPRVGHEGVVYGKDHQTDVIDPDDTEYVWSLRLDQKVAYMTDEKLPEPPYPEV